MVVYKHKEKDMKKTITELKKDTDLAYDILIKHGFKYLPSVKDVDKFSMGELIKLTPLFHSASSRIKLIEEKLKQINGWITVSASDERGDYIDNGKYFEMKTSSMNRIISALQIRPWHNIDEYRFFYVDSDSCSIEQFIIPKESMNRIVEKKGSYTHGTVKSNQENMNKEYSLHISLDNPNNKEFQLVKENCSFHNIDYYTI